MNPNISGLPTLNEKTFNPNGVDVWTDQFGRQYREICQENIIYKRSFNVRLSHLKNISEPCIGDYIILKDRLNILRAEGIVEEWFKLPPEPIHIQGLPQGVSRSIGFMTLYIKREV